MKSERNSTISILDGFVRRSECALCGSRERQVFRSFRQIPVEKCQHCGFMYSSLIMNETALIEYYRNSFGGLRHKQGQAVNARANAVVLKNILNFHEIGNWLDVGTGYGFLLKILGDKYGISTDGVELSVQEATFAREEFSLNICDKSLSESGLPKQQYDIVSCFEVIEHIVDPVSFVAELAEYVRPGGRLIIMTDNFESRAARVLRGGFPKWIPHTHVSHFAPESLRCCIRNVPSIKLEKEASFTPFETLMRQWLASFRSPSLDADSFDLNNAISSEMSGDYRFFRLRNFINPILARLNFHENLQGGSLMYAVCIKIA